MADNYLRYRASKNFEKYLKDFLTTGRDIGLPSERLTPSEWRELNMELASVGVQMVEREYRGSMYYFFTKATLRNRASKNFEKYLDACIKHNESAGLPVARLSDAEWETLNQELAPLGVKLVKGQSRDNGAWYYWFTRTEPQSSQTKANIYHQAREDIVNMLFDKIKKRYPNLADPTILEIIESRGTSTTLIYQKLRYKQDGHYTDVSEQDYNRACEYALMRCSNSTYPAHNNHSWNPRKWGQPHVSSVPDSWKKLNRDIRISNRQDWTWFRMCSGATLPPIHGDPNNVGFHISCNVNIFDKTLQALDDIVVQDGGQYIYAYKFPRADYYYDEILVRHDPITIYMYARNPELEQKIVRAMQPFVRSNEGLLDEMLGNGCSISPETSNNGGVSVGRKAAIDLSKMISEYRDRL